MVRELVNALASLEDVVVKEPLDRDDVISRCFRVCNAVVQCITSAARDPVWHSHARDAPRLDSLFQRYRIKVFPAFLERMVAALSDPSLQRLVPASMTCLLLSAVACSSSVLRLGDGSWPRHRLVSPDLVRAIYNFARCPASSTPVPDNVSNALLDTLAQIMSCISSEGVGGVWTNPDLPDKTSLITEVVNVASVITRTALRTPLPTRTTFTSLALLVISGHLIKQTNMVPVTVDLAKLAMVAASRCDDLLAGHVQAASQLIGLMMSMDLHTEKAGVPLMEMVKALHIVWSRYPTLSSYTSQLIMRQHQHAALEPDAFRAMGYSLHTCMTKAIVWAPLRYGNSNVRHLLGDEMRLISQTLVQVAASATRWILEGKTVPEEKAALDAWSSTPRFLRGMEALLRGNQEEEEGMLIFLMGASGILRNCVVSGAAVTSHMYSLMITIRKLILIILERQPGPAAGSTRLADWNWPPVQFLVQNLFTIMLVTDESLECSAESFRMYFVVGTTLQPLVRKLLHHRSATDVMGMFQQCTARHPIPDCDLTPDAWEMCIGDYTRRYEGRLLLGCCYLGCKNLSGPLDCILPTLLCSGCRRVRYCSEGCHRGDWASGGHSLVCGLG